LFEKAMALGGHGPDFREVMAVSLHSIHPRTG
jgi:hypothetical protein